MKSRPAMESTNEEEWRVLEEFYRAPPEETFRCTKLSTLLNDWNGEIDRAKNWKAKRRPQTQSTPAATRVPLA